MLSTSVFLALIGACVAATITPSMAPAMDTKMNQMKPMMMDRNSTINNTIYSIYVPRQIRPGIELVVNVQLIKSRNPINVSVLFESIDHRFSLNKSILVRNGSFVTLPIGMLPLGYNGIKRFNFTVNGTDAKTKMLVFTNCTHDFVFDSKSASILIETDKPIYQPKEAIRFRAICMTPDLRPLSGNVTYEVQDPKGNIVLLNTSVPLRKGVAGDHLNLSRHAMEGEWIIRFRYNKTEASVPVNVSVYQPPKFEVNMTCPKFFYPDSEGITVTVKANKTNGAPIYGKMQLIIDSNRRNLKISRNNFTGEMDLFISRKQIMRELRLNESSEHKIRVDCVVTENLTSIVYNSSAKMEYKQSKILIDVLSKPRVVKPGLRYQALVKVSDREWGTLMEQDRQKNNLIVVVQYHYRHNQTLHPNMSSCNCTSKPTCSCIDKPTCNCTNEPTCNCTNEPTCNCTNEPTCECMNEPICNCTGEPNCTCMSMPICNCTGESNCTCINNLTCNCTKDSNCNCTGEPNCNCTSKPICNCQPLQPVNPTLLPNDTYYNSTDNSIYMNQPIPLNQALHLDSVFYNSPDDTTFTAFPNCTMKCINKCSNNCTNRTTPLVFVYKVPPSGIVPIDFEVRNHSFESISLRVYTNETASIYPNLTRWNASKALSPTHSFIQILPLEDAAFGEVVVGKLAKFNVSTNKPVKEVQLMAICRGSVLFSRTVSRMDKERLMSNFTFNVTSQMTPSVTLIASYVTDKNEIVADSIKVNVELPLAHMMMKLNSSERSVEAGSNISISINSTAPYAFVGLRAVDQRVWLLQPRNNISRERVISDLELYSGMDNISDSIFRFSQGSQSKVAKNVFDTAGITVLSNALLYSLPWMPRRELNHTNETDMENQDHFVPQVKPVATWLWESGVTNDKGIAVFNATAPDAITSWEISAFSISESLGLGIADVQKLTVFRKFFVSLNLPLKVVRGEIIVVEANIFNNYDRNLTADIELNIPRKFEEVTLLRPGNDKSINGHLREVLIPSRGFATVKFPLRMDALGEVPIQIKASSLPLAVDVAERRVYIKPKGIQQCYSSSVLIRNPSEGQQDELLIKIPYGAVNGSANATVNIYGDILGSTISNLGKLLKAPNGTCEQNMINFAPDVFVSLYLRAVGNFSEEAKERAYRQIINGYMDQLRCKRADGSFSAFGDRDVHGSTWLTAFVAQCFSYARDLKKELIQRSVIENATRFLLRQQKEDGSFEENGQVIHQDLQGGANSPITVTAYVLTTLSKLQWENPLDTRLHVAIQKARRYLERSIPKIEKDAYALSLVSYALTLCGSRRAEQVGRKLDALAVETPNGFKFWKNRTEEPSTYLPRFATPYVLATPNQIETAAYALLRFARSNATNKALPVLKWIISKQNELGGYLSTQDTVVAVQALAKVAPLFVHEQNLSIVLTHNKDDAFVYDLAIHEKNCSVNESVEITPINGTVNVSSRGVGIALAQLSVCYNTPETPYDHESFTCRNVSLKKEDEASSNISMEFCCTLNERRHSTGMFLIEVGLLNGYTVDMPQEEQRNPMAKLIELNENTVNFYYDQLYPGDTQCIHLQLLKDANVGEIKPATVKAFEYYRPENAVYRMYNLEELSVRGPCATCGYECTGCPAPVLSEWKQWTDCVEFCQSENSTRVKDCVDPSLKERIEMHRCGLAASPTQIRRCAKDFRCPNVSDGLWNEMPLSYPQKYNRSHPCQVIGLQRSPMTVIPGTTLNGRDSYIRCNISLLGRNTTLEIREPEPIEEEELILDWDMDLSPESETIKPSPSPKLGFTVSFLIKLNFYESVNATTLFAIGKADEVPLIKLEKPTMGRNLTLSVAVGNKRDHCENISLSAIPLGNWTHVVAMWDEENGCQVWVNGVKVGQPRFSTIRHERPMPSDIELFLGRSTMNNTRGQGLVSGSYSALNVWFNRIPMKEVESLCKFYQEFLKFSGPEPLLSARHLRGFAPAPAKMCFNKPAFLSRLYARDAFCQ